jgi:plasmid maintenance system antidote protein VapI
VLSRFRSPWTQGDLASILGRPLQAVNEIVNGRKEFGDRCDRANVTSRFLTR